jgi:hypothetical protein
MADVKFADKGHVDSLEKFGFCAFRLTKEERECFHPEIGKVINLLLDDSTRGRRVAIRLVADQEEPDGGCTSIYAAAVSVFKRDEE